MSVQRVKATNATPVQRSGQPDVAVGQPGLQDENEYLGPSAQYEWTNWENPGRAWVNPAPPKGQS